MTVWPNCWSGSLRESPRDLAHTGVRLFTVGFSVNKFGVLSYCEA